MDQSKQWEKVHLRETRANLHVGIKLLDKMLKRAYRDITVKPQA